MKSINLKLEQNEYKIIVDESGYKDLGKSLKKLKLGQDAIVITSSVIRKLQGKKIESILRKEGFKVKVFELPDGEKAKTAKFALKLLEEIASYDVLKKPFIVAFGGGVIGDLAGFVAAVYKRGIPYIQIPTTFLAQIDSSIGGKTAIDLPVGKNLVGSFYQPKIVYSNVKVLKTLDIRQIRNGLAEAIKYGIIYDKKLFKFIANNYQKLLSKNMSALEHVVTRCSQIKAEVVMADEKETKKIRTILNFGHTVGHAIEAAGKYKLYQHGEAVALGMRVAAAISYELKMLSEYDLVQINRLISDVGLPEMIKKVSLKDILSIMQHDKKFVSGQNRFVLAKEIGKVSVVDGISLSVIRKSTKIYMS